ncbi:hypothetical protein LR48_Vigan10g248700 [Vigna angularis]|uniref:BHLH domain-containing protein n=2 Tax=Phaseolus angularis TaxID=3914 RepID=A0A0L9VNG0_PHAAN|nr:transcription factor UPBEAT1 [Vigna angularis]KOM56595.1 hypothetical protein LR48_Vigan10g248700 [Vigna angularis]BAU01339.1 hypothetical protein VIGAN_11055000 [Vigna angularis var. angularis]
MTTTTRHSYKLSLKRATKRTRTTRRRRRNHPLSQNLITTIDPSNHEKCHKNSQKLSQKLEALKNLIPSTNTEEEAVKPDQLFKETADYIVLLRTRVVVLQKLIEYYGNNSTQNDEHALLL